MPPQLPADTTPISPGWAALTIVGLGIFSVILLKEAYDVAKTQGWLGP